MINGKRKDEREEEGRTGRGRINGEMLVHGSEVEWRRDKLENT